MSLTEQGISHCERLLNVENLYDYRTSDRGTSSFQGRPMDVDPSTVYGVLGSIIGAIFGGVGDLLQTRAKMDTLSFSREQEYQADSLGLRYMRAGRYADARRYLDESRAIKLKFDKPTSKSRTLGAQ